MTADSRNSKLTFPLTSAEPSGGIVATAFLTDPANTQGSSGDSPQRAKFADLLHPDPNSDTHRDSYPHGHQDSHEAGIHIENIPAVVSAPTFEAPSQRMTPLETHNDEHSTGSVLVPVAPRIAWKWGVKRTLDVAGSGFGLFALSPALIVVAALVKMTSRGPVLFAQERVGEGGRVFKMYKFRSMVPNADYLKETLEQLNEASGPVFKMKRDPRITPVGRILRKFSLDELPQLWNVLAGDMSLVGPRPPVMSEVIKYEPWQLRRLSARPGLTCIWQVSGRSNIGFEEWVRMDLHYIDHWSLRLDLRLLLKTVRVVLSGHGAY